MAAEAYTLWLRLYDARTADWKTNEEQLAKVAAIIEEDRKEAALKERTAIVAWLRTNPDPIVRNWTSTQIEVGEHHGKVTE